MFNILSLFQPRFTIEGWLKAKYPFLRLNSVEMNYIGVVAKALHAVYGVRELKQRKGKLLYHTADIDVVETAFLYYLYGCNEGDAKPDKNRRQRKQH